MLEYIRLDLIWYFYKVKSVYQNEQIHFVPPSEAVEATQTELV